MNGLIDSYCRGCKYLMYVSCAGTNQKACDYIGATNKRRPWPAGKGCTVRETGRQYGARRGGG